MENKKVKGASPIVYDVIHFRSKLEMSMYKKLVENGLTPEYETKKTFLWEGFLPTVPCYTGDSTKELRLSTRRIQSITYTPDFYLEYNGKKVIIECKGIRNDTFPIKFKMFRKIMEESPDKENILIFEVYTIRQLMQAIDIIKYGVQ